MISRRAGSGRQPAGRLDGVGSVERGCHRHDRATRHAGRVGGSNLLLDVGEVAELLGVSRKTLYDRWRAWGLTAYRVGRHLRFRQRHVEDWLDRQEIRP